jgi:hypothetical protein
VKARCLYNKVGFEWGFFVSCGSQKIIATRWRSNQVTVVRAVNASWHPTAIICTRDGAATTWSLFAMFQNNVIVVVGCVKIFKSEEKRDCAESLRLCPECTQNVPRMCRECAETVQRQCKDCAETVPTVPRMCRYCAETMPRLCRDCAEMVLRLCRDCTKLENVLRLCRDGAETVSRLYQARECAETVSRIARDSAETVPRWCRDGAETVPRLCWDCAETVPRLCRDCAETVPRLAVIYQNLPWGFKNKNPFIYIFWKNVYTC